jgi:cytochrome o ubiquinol oxidase subunit IV
MQTIDHPGPQQSAPQQPAPQLPAPLQPYVTGFVFALVLTGIPFGLVAAGLLPRFTTLIVIAVFAVVQVVVHLRYFLHVDLESTPRENLLVLAFAAVLIFLMVGGTLWIMFDLNARMMVS